MFVDSTVTKYIFCCVFLRFSILSRWRERLQTAMCFLQWLGKVEMSCDCFGSVFIVYLNISMVFEETVTQSAARFADVYFFTKLQVMPWIRLAEMHVK